MTELESSEIRNETDRARQDNITLDFAKWNFQRIQAKLPASHDLWQQERDAVLRRQQSDNAAARARYLNKLDDERAAKQSERDTEIDNELEPEKRRLRNQWLADHPSKTEADFNREAWHLLKENLIEQHNAASLEATKQQMLQSGRY
jgi:hypothetical protein